MVEKLVWLLVRPATLDGGGLGMSPADAGALTFQQAMFFVSEFSSTGSPAPRDAEAMKQEVIHRYNTDPEYREWYRAKVEEALRKAKESLPRTKAG